MLTTLAQAKEYALIKVGQVSGEAITATEKSLIEDLLEEYFFEKVSELVSEEEIEKKKLISQEELEWYLSYEIPNYTTVLEQATAEWLSDYLSEEK